MADRLTHYDENGASRMVDVSEKRVTVRIALASGRIRMAEATLALLRGSRLAKGDVLEVARLAGIMGAKQTASLIPLCHPLPLDAVSIDFSFPDSQTVELVAEAKTTGRTGVEMEALTAASVAALTIYDMCKSVDRGMVIEQIRLEAKSGGRSGSYQRTPQKTDTST